MHNTKDFNGTCTCIKCKGTFPADQFPSTQSRPGQPGLWCERCRPSHLRVTPSSRTKSQGPKLSPPTPSPPANPDGLPDWIYIAQYPADKAKCPRYAGLWGVRNLKIDDIVAGVVGRFPTREEAVVFAKDYVKDGIPQKMEFYGV